MSIKKKPVKAKKKVTPMLLWNVPEATRLAFKSKCAQNNIPMTQCLQGLMSDYVRR